MKIHGETILRMLRFQDHGKTGQNKRDNIILIRNRRGRNMERNNFTWMPIKQKY